MAVILEIYMSLKYWKFDIMQPGLPISLRGKKKKNGERCKIYPNNINIAM